MILPKILDLPIFATLCKMSRSVERLLTATASAKKKVEPCRRKDMPTADRRHARHGSVPTEEPHRSHETTVIFYISLSAT